MNCPTCRQKFKVEQEQPLNMHLRNMMAKLKIQCRHEGCKEIVELENVAHHEAKCGFSKSKCLRCDLEMTAVEMPTHLLEHLKTSKENDSSLYKISSRDEQPGSTLSCWQVANNAKMKECVKFSEKDQVFTSLST